MGSLPYEIEEDLAVTVGHMVRRNMIPPRGLGEQLYVIAREVGLDCSSLEVISDPKWVQKFTSRWAHKICEHRRPGTSITASQGDHQVRDVRGNEDSSTTLLSSDKQATQQQPRLRFEEGNEQADIFVVDVAGKEFTACPGQARASDIAEETAYVTEEAWLQGSVKRVSLGLRGTIKPVNRFQYPASPSPKKKRQRVVDRSEIVTSDSAQSEEELSMTDEDPASYAGRQPVDRISQERSPFIHARPVSKVVGARESDGGTEVIEITTTDTDEESDAHPVKKQTSRAETPSTSNISRESKGLRRTIKPVVRFQSAKFRKKKKKKQRDDGYLQILSTEEESSSSDAEESTRVSPVRSRRRKKPQKDEEDKGRSNFELVHAGLANLEDLCLACGTKKNVKGRHPLFHGGLCEEHRMTMHEWFFTYDSDGYHSRCSVCCMGDSVVLCDIRDCGRCYCKTCLETLVGRGCFDGAVREEQWICYFCKDSEDSLLRKRSDWQEGIQRLYRDNGQSQYPSFSVPSPIPVEHRHPIRVLSLFDGIATGIVALKQLGLEIGSFVASEIDEDAIRLVQNKHTEVTHIGDVTKVTDRQLYEMGPFDLLLGGSPCNDLSGANPRRRGLLDAEGSGCLFFDFYRILRTLEPPRTHSGQRTRPFFWLFENVVSMKGVEKKRISRFLQCEPKMADARYVSAAARPRLFWGNLPGLRDRSINPGVKDRLTVQDCLEPGRKALVKKLNTITTKYTCLYQGRGRQAPVLHNGKEDVLWTTEIERVFGVPEHYTDVNNLGPRERLALLGKSWSVPVIRRLLAPLKEYFSGVQQPLSEQRLSSASWWS